MIAHTFPVRVTTASCRLFGFVSVLLVAASFLLTGCGGGGASAGIAPAALTASYSDSRVTLPDAASRSFAPNYASTLESNGIWNGRTVSVYCAPGSEGVVQEALQRWSDATGGFFHWTIATSAADAQVTITPVPASEFSNGTVGRTRYTYNTGQNELVNAEVRYATTGIEDDQVRVVVHEMGHVLGIHGHSDSEPDVMYPALTSRNVITDRDLNTLFWLYRDTAAGSVTPSRSIGKEVSVILSCGGSE